MIKIQQRLKYVEQNITAKNMTEVGYPVFVKNTPVRTGNARSKTKKTETQISADYPYATLLDQGRSKQSPKGMTKPTIDAIRAWIKQKIG